jgi:hypothetical protein
LLIVLDCTASFLPFILGTAADQSQEAGKEFLNQRMQEDGIGQEIDLHKVRNLERYWNGRKIYDVNNK